MKLLLVDGHYYAYRSFYAIPNLTNSKGMATNAIFGFIKAIRRMTQELKPDFGAIVFDCGIPEWRLKLQPEYKANRKETPASLETQIPSLKRVTELLGFHLLCIPNQEADDGIATLARMAASEVEVVLATNDKDLMQLVNEKVSIYSSAKSENGEAFQLLKTPEVTAKWGVSPEQIGDLLALTGDASDNIPGVPGVGPKTAANLIQQFGNLENLLRNLPEIKPEKIRNLMEQHRIQILANREMVRLDHAVQIPTDWKTWKIQLQWESLIEHLKEWEFRSLLRDYEQEFALQKKMVQKELF